MAIIRIRGPMPPISAQLELIRDWSAIASTVWTLIEAELLPAYRSEFSTRGDARDDQESLPRRISLALASMAANLRRLVPRSLLRQATVRAGVSVDRTNAATFNRQLSVAIGVPAEVRPRGKNALISSWVREATDLITSVRDGAIPGLRVAVEQAWEQGLTAAELEQRLRAKGLPLSFGTVEGRTKVIARDQVGKLNGRLTELRHRAMGVRSYRWRHSADSRVRPVHRAREGKRYSWNKPPPGGHPGEPVQCRCSAEAVVDTDKAIRQPEVQRAGGLGTVALAVAAAALLSEN